jgi:hypothetical protein
MKIKNKQKSVKIQTSFSSETLTNYSGALPVYNFMNKLGIPKLLNTLGDKLGGNAKYLTGTIFGLLMLGINCGMNRMAKIESFSLDCLIQKIFGFHGKLDADTIYNRFKRFSRQQTERLIEINFLLSNKVHNKLKQEQTYSI